MWDGFFMGNKERKNREVDLIAGYFERLMNDLQEVTDVSCKMHYDLMSSGTGCIRQSVDKGGKLKLEHIDSSELNVPRGTNSV